MLRKLVNPRSCLLSFAGTFKSGSYLLVLDPVDPGLDDLGGS